METEILQLKVTLRGTQPPIWRRLAVPATMTLAQLHDVLQIAMGWQDCHMHHFMIARRFYGAPQPGDGGPATLDERKISLNSVLAKKGAKAIYEYDFGDSWEHEIAVEKVLPPEAGIAYPRCIAGARACPPEDCGGVGGFYSLLETLDDPDSPDHEEMLEWADDFDPEAFSVDDVNALLCPPPRRKRR